MLVDDTPRTGGFGWLSPVQQASYDTTYLEAKEFHASRIRTLVIATLAGGIPFCPGWFQRDGQAPRIERLDCSDLLDTMGATDRPELFGKLFAAAFDRDTRAETFGEAEDLLAAYVDKTADLLAKEEARKS